MSTGAKLAVALQRNRELVTKLYTIRGEAPPDDAGCAARWAQPHAPLAHRAHLCATHSATPAGARTR